MMGGIKVFCSNCGSKINPDSKFCGSCGQKTMASNASSSAPPPPPAKPQMAPPPPLTMAPHGRNEYTQPQGGIPSNPPSQNFSHPGQGYSQSSQGFQSQQQFNPQFNQKQKSSKGCLFAIVLVVVIALVLVAVGFAYVYFKTDLLREVLPSTNILSSIGTSSPEKVSEQLFEAIANEDVDGFISLITTDSIEFIKNDMEDESVPLQDEIREGLEWINYYGTEDYGSDWHKGITYQLSEESGDRAVVVATLGDQPIDINLIKEIDKWKIDWANMSGW